MSMDNNPYGSNIVFSFSNSNRNVKLSFYKIWWKKVVNVPQILYFKSIRPDFKCPKTRFIVIFANVVTWYFYHGYYELIILFNRQLVLPFFSTNFCFSNLKSFTSFFSEVNSYHLSSKPNIRICMTQKH